MSDMTEKDREVAAEFGHRVAASRSACDAHPELQKKHGKKLDALRAAWEKNTRATPLAAKQALLDELRQLNRQIEHEAMYPS